MKFVKLSIVALSMGLFLASCGGNSETTTPTEDTTTTAPVTEPAPAVPAVTDTTAAPAVTDTTTAAPAPAAH